MPGYRLLRRARVDLLDIAAYTAEGWNEQQAERYVTELFASLDRLVEHPEQAAGAPPEILVPLMTRTIENHFDLTGPIARGDWATVDAHIDALSRELPDLVPMYRALAEATRR